MPENQQDEFNETFKKFYGNMSQGIPYVSSNHSAELTPQEVQKFHEQFFAVPQLRDLHELSDGEILQIYYWASTRKFTTEQIARSAKISCHLVTMIQRHCVRRDLLQSEALPFLLARFVQ